LYTFAETAHNDAGGHDEYQEMHQSFLTSDALYCLLFDGSRPGPGEENAEVVQREMEEKLTRWAALVSACAPGTGTATLLILILILILRLCVDIHTDTDTVMVYWCYDVSCWHCGMIGSAV